VRCILTAFSPERERCMHSTCTFGRAGLGFDKCVMHATQELFTADRQACQHVLESAFALAHDFT
jgi:hypothetical protein